MKKYHLLLLGLVITIFFHGCYDDPQFPLANFKIEGGNFKPEYKFNLDASESISQISLISDSIMGLQYRWDLNGDHIWDDTPWSYSPIYTALLPGVRSDRYLGLQVKNSTYQTTEIYKQVACGLYSQGYYICNMIYRGLKVPSVRYSELKQYWTTEDIRMEASDIVSDNINNDSGSYIAWGKATEDTGDFLHVPTLEDWLGMMNFCGGMNLAGYNMAVDVDHGLKLKYGGLNNNGSFIESGECGYYWTSTEVNNDSAYAIKIIKGKDQAEVVSLPKSYRLTIRLVNSFKTQTSN